MQLIGVEITDDMEAVEIPLLSAADYASRDESVGCSTVGGGCRCRDGVTGWFGELDSSPRHGEKVLRWIGRMDEM